ncbi:MAG: patatin-like phospholipase family protein, partial [Melioribacteraceae bacterium]|nr:patatin-like phospholipase family protein [Melioribacteraceae bacterium]
NDTNRPKIGLVLSGGGAKGFAHIGVLEIFEQEGIPIDYIAGTSIGSIIGGLYAIGYNTEQLKKFVTDEEWIDLLSDHISREYKSFNDKYDQDRYLVSFKLKTDEGISLPAGVVEGHNIMNKLCELTAKYHEVWDFNNFPIPFACIAADLETGEEVVIKSGFLPEAMFASMSIPTIFAPTSIDDKLLVDGGIVNNFPADIVKEMGADIIIGIDIQSKPLTKEEIKDLTDIVGQMISYMGFEKYRENKKLCSIIIEPDISEYGTASFSNSAADSLITNGRKAALKKIEQIKELLIQNNIPLNNNEKQYEFEDEFELNNFMVEGISETTVDYLLEKSDLKFPQTYTFESISNGIRKLYGSDNFKKVYYKFLFDQDSTFRLYVDEKNTNSLNAGFNFNSVDKAAILLNITLRNELFKGTRFTFDAKLSKNTMFGTSFQFSNKSIPEIDLSLVYKNFNLEIFDRTDKISEADIRYLMGSFSLFEIYGSNYLFNLGLRSEYFKFNPFFSDTLENNIEFSENTVLGGFLNVRFDNLDDKYYPTSGFDLKAEFTYASNEADNLIENTTTPIISYNLLSALSMGRYVSIIPSFYGRLLLNDNSEFFRSNMLGGTRVNQLLDYHLPFIGVDRAIVIKDKAFISK